MELELKHEDRLLLQNIYAELKRYNERISGTQDRPDLVLSIQEAAVKIGKSRQTISRLVREGRLHKVLRGGKTGILASELNPLGNGRDALT